MSRSQSLGGQKTINLNMFTMSDLEEASESVVSMHEQSRRNLPMSYSFTCCYRGN